MGATGLSAPPPLLRLRGINRSFGATVAVRGVDLDVTAGSIHALLGENGAGKSTLMNVVYGIHPADSGEISVDGATVQMASPRDALVQRISMVHQHHELIPSLTVAESVALVSKHPTWHLDQAEAARRVTSLGEDLGVHLDPRARVGDLSLGDRQRLEIMCALDRSARLIILDEPTAVLAPSEVEPLFGIMRSLAKSGTAIVLITHRMKEVFSVSDTISVMRRGNLLATMRTADAEPQRVLELIAGQSRPTDADADSDRRRPPTRAPKGRKGAEDDVALEVRAAVVPARPGTTGLQECTLQARRGEILGVVGVEGNGQHDLVEVLAGVRVLDSGAVLIDGIEQPSGRTPAGVSVVPSDRHHEALVLDLSTEENYVLPRLPGYTRLGILRRNAIREEAEEMIEAYSVLTASAAIPMRSMSGGNQQKVVLARALASDPKVLVVSQATRGLDPGSAAHVIDHIRATARSGAAVVFIGSDLDEIIEIADRAVVFYRGRCVGETTDPRGERHLLTELMVGGRAGE